MDDVPDMLFDLVTIAELDLSNNLLHNLPDEITNLKKLEKLFVNNNRLDSLPASLVYAHQDLGYGLLTTLPSLYLSIYLSVYLS